MSELCSFKGFCSYASVLYICVLETAEATIQTSYYCGESVSLHNTEWNWLLHQIVLWTLNLYSCETFLAMQQVCGSWWFCGWSITEFGFRFKRIEWTFSRVQSIARSNQTVCARFLLAIDGIWSLPSKQ